MSSDVVGSGHQTQSASRFFLSYIWKIPKFDGLKSCQSGREIRSPVFGNSDAPKDRLQILMYPNGEAEEDAGHVSLFLKVSSETEEKAIKVQQHYDVGGTRKSDFSDIDSYFRGWGQYQGHRQLKLIDGALFVKVTLEWGDKASPDLSNILLKDNLSDVTIKVGSVSLPAHRAVLAAQSSVFQGMFAHPDVIENQNKEVDLSHVGQSEQRSVDAVRHFLAFLYTGAFAHDGTNLRCNDLVRLSDLYDVAGVKRTAEDMLIRCLSGNTFCYTARLHRQSQRLFDACQAFVEEKRGEIPAADWEALEKEDPAFCLKLLQHFVPVAKKPRRE